MSQRHCGLLSGLNFNELEEILVLSSLWGQLHLIKEIYGH